MEVFTIQEEKNYYKSKEIISDVSNDTGYSINEVSRVINSMSKVVREKLAVSNNMEIQLFPGLKLNSRYIPTNESVSKRLNIKSDYSLFLSANFTDDFKRKVRILHN